MGKSYLMHSKLYVKAKTGSFVLRILLNICLAVYLLASIIIIIFDGISISIVGGMCLAAFIVLSYNRRPSARGHYEAVQAEIIINSDAVNIVYYQVGNLNGGKVIYKIPTERIRGIEFSNKLCCIHFIGDMTVTYVGKKTKIENAGNCYFYVEKGYEESILNELVSKCGRDIHYMDIIKSSMK